MKTLIEKLIVLESEVSNIRDEQMGFELELSNLHRSISEFLTKVSFGVELNILEESVLNLEECVQEDNYNEDENFDETSSPFYPELLKAREELNEFKL